MRKGSHWTDEQRKRYLETNARSEVRERKSVAQKEAQNRPEVRARFLETMSYPEVRANQIMATKAALADPEVRKKISAASKEMWADPEFKERHSVAIKKVFTDPEFRERFSVIQKEVQNRPEVKEQRSAVSKERFADPEFKERWWAATKAAQNRPEVRERRSVIMRKRWADPEEKARLSAALVAFLKAGNDANRGRHQTLQERINHSVQQQGCLSSDWIGFTKPEAHRIRQSPEYVALRTAVFERDNYTCRDCGQHGGRLEVHHIHEFAQYPDERFIVENCITLCLKCHDKTKPGRPRKAGLTADVLNDALPFD